VTLAPRAARTTARNPCTSRGTRRAQTGHKELHQHPPVISPGQVRPTTRVPATPDLAWWGGEREATPSTPSRQQNSWISRPESTVPPLGPAPVESCQGLRVRYKSVLRHSAPLIRQLTQRNLAVLFRNLGILKIEGKKRKNSPRNHRARVLDRAATCDAAIPPKNGGFSLLLVRQPRLPPGNLHLEGPPS